MKRLLIGIVMVLSVAGMGISQDQVVVPVGSFNLQKYLGSWYEIARLPNWFEKDLVAVTASYSLKKNGMVKVINEGYRDGRISRAVGKAKFAKRADIGHLRVSFFGPFYADYIVIELDPDYQYALVGDFTKKYLWILSRTPQLEAPVVEKLIATARALGFETDLLFFCPQTDMQPMQPAPSL